MPRRTRWPEVRAPRPPSLGDAPPDVELASNADRIAELREHHGLEEDAPLLGSAMGELLGQTPDVDEAVRAGIVSRTLATGYDAPPPVDPVVGVSPRPGLGYDLSRLDGLPDGATAASILPELDEPRRPGRHAGREERDAYNCDEGAFLADLQEKRDPRSAHAHLDGFHGLYVPGDHNANPTQVASPDSARPLEDARENVPTSDKDARELASRDAYEQALFRDARLRGMPTLAICGGSWRMLEAFGGQVETIPGNGERRDNRSGHLGGLNDRAHGVALAPNTLLGGTAPVEERDDGESERRHRPGVDEVNSTHWAVASERDGRLVRREGAEEDPSASLEISARGPGWKPDHTVVEGFETRHGPPMMGVQWHPEAYLVPGRARDNASPEAVENAERLFRGFAQATRAYAGRQQVNDEIRARVPRAPATRRED